MTKPSGDYDLLISKDAVHSILPLECEPTETSELVFFHLTLNDLGLGQLSIRNDFTVNCSWWELVDQVGDMILLW